MTTFEWITSLTSIGGFAFLAWSVLMLRRQLQRMEEQQDRRQTEALEQSAVDTLDIMNMGVTEAFLQFPELRSIFNEGEGGLEPREADRDTLLRAAAVAETLCDSMERALEAEGKAMSSLADGLREWVHDSFRHSSFLRTWLDQHRHWYRKTLLEVLHRVELENKDKNTRRSPGREPVPPIAEDPQTDQ